MSTKASKDVTPITPASLRDYAVSSRPVSSQRSTLSERGRPEVSYSTFTGEVADTHAALHASTNSKRNQKQRRWSASTERAGRSANMGVVGLGRRKSSRFDKSSRSLSRALLGDSEEEEAEEGLQYRYARRASTYFMSHPASYSEAISTWTTPRRNVSLIARLDTELDHEEQDGTSSESQIPYGVRKMEVISRYVPKIMLYMAIYLITLFTSLSSTTTPAVEPYLLSLFGGHKYISAIAIVTSIAYAVCKPPMAKILDVFGRAEGLAISAVLYGAGHLLVSSAHTIVTFGIARVVGSAGAQGINLAQQVIVADITSLASRALVTSTIFLPWLITPWVGPPLGQAFKDMGEAGYRAVYTVFGIMVPISCLFLLVSLWRGYERVLNFTATTRPAIDAVKAHDTFIDTDDALTWQSRSFQSLAIEARDELDLLGIFYLMVGCTLFLLPLSLAADRGWSDPLYPALALIGLAVLGLLGYHEAYVAESPLIPTRLLMQRTVMSGCCLGAFHFFTQFAYESYFSSFLQVSRYYSARDASYISESYVFSASIAALFCGYLVKISQRYKIWMILGILIHMVGAYMMVRFRSLDNTTSELVMSQVIGGIGGGFTTLSAQLGVQAVVDHQDIAIVTAVFLTITQIGGAVGGSVSGAVWTTFLPRKLSKYLPNADSSEISKIFGSMSAAIAYEPGSVERLGIDRAYFEVQKSLNIIALIGLLPCLLCGLMMQNVRLSVDEDDEDDEEVDRVVVMGDVMGEHTNPFVSSPHLRLLQTFIRITKA